MNSSMDEVSVGVDWLTVTAQDGAQVAMLREYGIELLMSDAGKGNRVRPFTMGVYKGGGTNHVGVGEWRGRVLVAVSGAQSNEEAPELLQLAQGCSRIDLQVSVRQSPYDPLFALKQWVSAIRRAEQEGKPPQYDLYARRRGGSTLYIGDGASRYLARMYERFPKSKEEAERDVWRFEVQCRRERAVQAATMYQASTDPTSFTRGYVHQHFRRRGVPPLFDADYSEAPPPLPPDKPDADRSIRWLGSSVRPVLDRLEGMGRERDGLAALGLEAPAPRVAPDSTAGLTH